VSFVDGRGVRPSPAKLRWTNLRNHSRRSVGCFFMVILTRQVRWAINPRGGGLFSADDLERLSFNAYLLGLMLADTHGL